MILPFNDALELVLPFDDDWRRAQAQLIRIGFDRAAGFVRGGHPAWAVAGLPVDRLNVVTIEHLREMDGAGDAEIVDVRYDPEWRGGHMIGATHIAIGALPVRLGDVPVPNGKQLVTMCAGGTRAVLAGSLLKRVGFEPSVVPPAASGNGPIMGGPRNLDVTCASVLTQSSLTKSRSSFRPARRRFSVTTLRRCSLIAPRSDQKSFAIFRKELLGQHTSTTVS